MLPEVAPRMIWGTWSRTYWSGLPRHSTPSEVYRTVPVLPHSPCRAWHCSGELWPCPQSPGAGRRQCLGKPCRCSWCSGDSHYQDWKWGDKYVFKGKLKFTARQLPHERYFGPWSCLCYWALLWECQSCCRTGKNTRPYFPELSRSWMPGPHHRSPVQHILISLYQNLNVLHFINKFLEQKFQFIIVLCSWKGWKGLIWKSSIWS